MPSCVGCGTEIALHDPALQLCVTCTTSKISSGLKASAPFTPLPLSGQTQELERLREDLAVAKHRYQQARLIADDVEPHNPDGPLALKLALHEYSRTTTLYSEALIESTNRILRGDDVS